MSDSRPTEPGPFSALPQEEREHQEREEEAALTAPSWKPAPSAVLPEAVTSEEEQEKTAERALGVVLKKPAPVEEEPPVSRSRFKKWLCRLLWASLLCGVLALGLVGFFVLRTASDLPSMEELSTGYAPPQVTRIFAADGTLLGSIYAERRTVVPLDKIPDHVKSAFLAAEDANFYEHEGLNYLGLARAMLVNLKAGRVRQGGSTITQQVVKNVLLDADRTYTRKIKETLLAFRLEQELDKDEILGMYLNHIYLGHGRYGVEEASRFLFGKHVQELDVPEAALLAGIVAAPERFSPRRNEELALRRRHYVLGQMLSKGFMTREVYEVADAAPLRLAPAVETESDISPEFVEQGRRLLREVVGDEARQGGFSVYTTLHPELQVAARQAVRQGLDAYLKRQKLAPPYTLEQRRLWGPLTPPETKLRQHGIYVGRVLAHQDEEGTLDVQVGELRGRVSIRKEERYNPQHLAPSRFASLGAALRVRLLDDPKTASEDDPVRLRLELGPQAALVALDISSGEVVASVGSYEALAGGLDRSVQARRQPGSTFKPFVYSYALHTREVTAASLFTFPAQKKKAEEEAWDKFLLRPGLARSDNRMAEEVLERVGAHQVVSWARALGIQSRLGATKSLALGAYEVTPLEMATAFSVFASGGTLREPQFIRRIESGRGEVPLPERPPARPVVDPEVAYLTTHLLTSVIEEGTGQRARVLKRPLAGKTGTTNQAKDAWFVGYSTEYVVAVWVGYDDALPLGWGESGGVTALPIWIDFMKAASQGKPVVDFPRPPGLIDVAIDPETGLLPRPGQENTKMEIFLRGTEPTEEAPTEPEPEEVDAAEPGEEQPGETKQEEKEALGKPDDDLPEDGDLTRPPPEPEGSPEPPSALEEVPPF